MHIGRNIARFGDKSSLSPFVAYIPNKLTISILSIGGGRILTQSRYYKICLLALMLLVVMPASSSAEDSVSVQRPDAASLPFKQRIALKTNTVDWVLMMPNFTIDYDIKNTPYEKVTLGMGAKYNWRSAHNYVPYYVYNMFDLRTDLRYYWRQQAYRTDDGTEWQKAWVASRPRFWERWFTRLRLFRTVENPREWISFFAGPYLSYTSYNLKLGEVGKQGDAFGLGGTFGIALPLYGYRNGSALDIELGASAGWHLTTQDRYVANIESNCYSLVDHTGLRLIPYPLISDLRVALVYRLNSIKNQHTEIDEMLHARHRNMYERDTIQNNIVAYNNKISDLKYKTDQENRKIREQLKQSAALDSLFHPTLLNPIVLQLLIPAKYTKNDTDTIPRLAVVNTVEDIGDPLLLQMRKEIDSIPGITGATIDQIFVKRYKFISDDASIASINRAGLVKDIYVALNDEIANNNRLYTESSSTVLDNYTEYARRRTYNSIANDEIAYSIPVSRSVLSKNDRIKWENYFKQMTVSSLQQRTVLSAAIADSTRQAQAAQPIATVATDSLQQTTATDSLQQAFPADSLQQTIATDSLQQAFPADTLQQTIATDSVAAQTTETTVITGQAVATDDAATSATVTTDDTQQAPLTWREIVFTKPEEMHDEHP